jgi:signal peptidase I
MEEVNNVSEVVASAPVQAVQPQPVAVAQPVVAQPDHTRLLVGLQYLKKTVAVFLQIAVFLFLIRAFAVEPAIVNGRSMEMTLVDTDRVLVNKFQMLFDAPDRLDVVQMYDEASGNYYIKRVIGLPGETVLISGGTVCIEDVIGVGTCLDETYLQDFVYTAVQHGYPTSIEVSENHYFVMGDNRLMSTDSRVLGPIGRNFLLGNVMGVE